MDARKNDSSIRIAGMFAGVGSGEFNFRVMFIIRAIRLVLELTRMVECRRADQGE